MAEHHPYLPVAEYALLSDCQSVALVSRSGSIDWCCLPRVNHGSVYGRLLDWEKGGFCFIQRLAVMLHHLASRSAWGCLLRRPPQEEDRGRTIKRVSTERLSKATWAKITAGRGYSIGAPALTNKAV